MPLTAGVFCRLLKISLGNPNLKILDFSKLFYVFSNKEKILKNYFYSFAEHFEIWVRKSRMYERVKKIDNSPLI